MDIKTVSKEELQQVLTQSKSLREVILKFNLNPNGSGGYNNIKKKITNFGLDIPNYHYYGDGRKQPKLLDDEVFIENSTYPRHALKKRIIDNDLIPYICGDCGNLGIHNNKPLVLELDHINGINNDNRLVNLRFLCPNCHSQTKTYSGKANKGKQRKQTKKKPMNRQHLRKVDRPPYEQLMIEINELGYCGTGRKYGVSDNAIRKWVKGYKNVSLV